MAFNQKEEDAISYFKQQVENLRDTSGIIFTMPMLQNEDVIKKDRDSMCGYNGIIDNVCPKCGRTEDSVPFERIRRITGYLVGTLDRFNDAKRDEVENRVKHLKANHEN